MAAAPWPRLTVHEPSLKRALTRKVGLPGWCIALQARMNWHEGSGKAFQARLSANDLLSLRVSPFLQLHRPATSLTTSHPRRHHLPTASTWLAWDRPIYVTAVSLNTLIAFSTSARSTRTTMTARVGIRLPFSLPFLILLLLIIQLNNTVLCASFIFLFLQSLQQDLASSSHPITST